MIPGPATVVFTDLDGTLLDAETYSFEPARRTLQELRRGGTVLVPCTSKTAAETRHFMERLRLRSPFIVENGGGIHVPRGFFKGVQARVPLSVGYAEVLRGMARLKEIAGGAIRGFHDMTALEIADETGLPLPLARRARRREFDEPFRLIGPALGLPRKLEARATACGLRISRGGRFWHLHGATDKGRAVDRVSSWFRAGRGLRRTIGAGDSELDLPMLEAVDIPVIIPSPRTGHDPVLVRSLKGAILAPLPGPKGWAISVARAVNENMGARGAGLPDGAAHSGELTAEISGKGLE